MEAPPDLTKRERDALVARCPEKQQPLFLGWLNGTHDLDGTLKEVAVS